MTDKRITGDNPEQLARLFNACDKDWEYEVLETLCFRSGLLWKCTAESDEFSSGTCGYNNHEEDSVCADCGAPNPSHDEKTA